MNRASPTLRELRIRNFAVIDEVRLELGPGLTVLSGETGAGKSILVGALSLLVGERASSDMVRQGEERALIEACFDVTARPNLLRRIEEAGIEAEDGWLILRRELNREGRNRAWVNGSPATAGLVGELGSALVDLHGQHEHQALLRRAAQRRILDAYAGADGLAAEVRETHAKLAEVESRIEETRRRAAASRERADFLRFKLSEIEGANLEPGEEERLTAEARRLEHSEELMSLAATLHEVTYEGDEALVDRLGALRRPLEELVRIDPEAASFSELRDAAQHALEELGRRLGSYRGSIEHDPARLEEVRARLDRLFRLKRKYGPELGDVIEAGRTARAELEAMEGSELQIAGLHREADALRERLTERAAVLTEKRRGAGSRLEAAMNELLPELGMSGGRFEVSIEPMESVGASGAERIEFLATLNPGFDPAPLARIASGGEMSRLMLALKTTLVEVDDVPCLVFDEIDSGVGGAVAHQVAERLARVAASHQVFVVTHLAQIAARAEEQLSVHKRTEGARPATRVTRLDGAERIRELARMLGGDPASEVSRRHAEELLTGAGTAGSGSSGAA